MFFNVGGRSECKVKRLRDVIYDTKRVFIEKNISIPPLKTKYSYEDYSSFQHEVKQDWHVDNKNTAHCKKRSVFDEPDFEITDSMKRARYLSTGVEADKIFESDVPNGYVLTPSGVYEFDNPSSVKDAHQWNDPDITSISFCLNINHDYFLMTTGTERSNTFKEKTWRVSKKDFSRKLLKNDAYNARDIASRIITPKDLEGVILVVFHDNLDWGYGGSCSRPKFSTLILFNNEYAEGLELATFSFSAGTVMDITYRKEIKAFTIACDPSRPPAANKLKNLGEKHTYIKNSVDFRLKNLL